MANNARWKEKKSIKEYLLKHTILKADAEGRRHIVYKKSEHKKINSINIPYLETLSVAKGLGTENFIAFNYHQK